MSSAKPQLLINNPYLLAKCIIPRITFNQRGNRWDFCLIIESHSSILDNYIDNLKSNFNNLNKRLKLGRVQFVCI